MAFRVVNAPPQDSTSYVVLAAELHEDRVVIHLVSAEENWHRVEESEDDLGAILQESDGPLALLAPKPSGLGLEDDLGTTYLKRGGSGSGDGDVKRLVLVFNPAVPPDAKVLKVELPTGTVELTV